MRLPSVSLALLLAFTGATADKPKKKGVSPHASKPKQGASHLSSGTPEGGPGPLIVGGDPAPVDAYPWFVRFECGCGGSLISRQYVLSAAHCSECFQPGEVAQVGAHTSPFGGGVDAPNMNGGQAMESRTIASFTLHPNYDPYSLDHDFALVKLEDPVNDTMPVPIDGHDDGSSVVDGYGEDKTHLFPIGLGATSSGGPGSDVLLHVDVDFVPQDECSASYNDSDEITNAMMCAADAGQDSCQGDSGGPLWDRDEGVQVGVVSFGIGCADPNYPGVYARISTAIAWIQRQVCAGTDDPASDPFCQGGSFAPTSSPYPTHSSTTYFPTFARTTFAPTGAPIVCPESTIKVAITTDEYPQETSWQLARESDGVTIASKDNYVLEETLHEHVYCVPMEAYTFTIEDSAGDGLCCEYGEGSYEVSMDGDVMASGGVFTYSESTTFGIVDVDSYHTLESGACAAPVWTRTQCKSAATMTGREWKGVISNRNKPYGCVIVSKSDEVAFNIKGNKWVACTAHTPCMCAGPYALEENKCDAPLTEPLGKSECEEAASVLGPEFVWEGVLDTEDKPRGCFVKAKRKNSGKIKGGDLSFNENGNAGTGCKWGMPCVCSI